MKRLILVTRYKSTFYKNQPYMKKWTQREIVFLVSCLFLPIFTGLPHLGEGSFSAVAMKAEEPSGGGAPYSPLFMSPNPYSATMM